LTFFLKIHTPKTPLLQGLMAIDWLGTLTFTGGTIMLLFGLEFGGIQYPWGSATVICLIVFGCVSYAVFAGVETYARYPLMPGRLFRNTSVVFCYVCDFCHGICFGAAAYFLPLYFQSALGATPIQSGVWMLAVTLPLAVCTIGSGILIKKTGRYSEIIRISMAFTALSFGLFINLPAERDWPRLILFQILCALGVAPNLQALLIALQALVSQADLAVGTAMFAFVRQISVGIGVVIGQVIFQSRMGEHLGDLVAAGISDDLATSLAEGSTISMGYLAAKLTSDQQFVFREAVTDSMSKLWIFFCAIGGVGLISSFFIEQIVLSHDHVETKTGLAAEEAKIEDLKNQSDSSPPAGEEAKESV
jgi:Major Facilitator Superfamily